MTAANNYLGKKTTQIMPQETPLNISQPVNSSINWEEHVNNKGKHSYYNPHTNQVSTNMPSGNVWVELINDENSEGAPYYYNPSTKQTTYNKPNRSKSSAPAVAPMPTFTPAPIMNTTGKTFNAISGSLNILKGSMNRIKNLINISTQKKKSTMLGGGYFRKNLSRKKQKKQNKRTKKTRSNRNTRRCY